MIFERVRSDIRLAKIRFGESVAVDDQDAVRLQIADVRFQGRWIHRHQHVHRIARGEHVAGGELNLESADAGERARRSANFGGIIWKSC